MIRTQDSKEITQIYHKDRNTEEIKEIKEIYDKEGHLIFKNWNEIEGVLPLKYKCRTDQIEDYKLYGNILQDGTPIPQNPVMPQGTGVRTDNLAKYWKNAYVKPSSGEVTSQHRNGMAYPVSVSAGQTITFSANADNFSIGIAVFRYFDGTTPTDMIFRELTAYTYTATENCYAVVWCNYDNTTIMSESNFDLCKAMLNLGSTALPYEPYGYKLPITVNGTEYPIYLGQVETTRRVKKLVLTGEEIITKAASNSVFTMQLGGSNTPLSENAVTTVSTHYLAQNNVAGTGNVVDMHVCIRRGYSTLYIGDTRYDNANDFKSYLAAQYAAGTPVTVWYVLATPETAVVNEPLMKIGDYADTISAAQAGVTIPTVSGANILDMASPVKPSEVYVKGKGIKPTGYGQLVDVNGVNILDKDSKPIYVHGQ